MELKRNWKVELLRFLAAVFIMNGHRAIFFEINLYEPFLYTWYFVEMFFIFSGYFLISSVYAKGEQNSSFDENLMFSIKYTVQKFKGFLPYTVLPIVLMYIIDSYKMWSISGVKGSIEIFENLPFEVMFLSIFNNKGTRLIPLWYMSALFVVYPIMVMIIKYFDKCIVKLISAMIPIIFYLTFYSYGMQDCPTVLLRAMSGMLIGINCFLIIQYINKINFSKFQDNIMNIIEIIVFVIPIICAYFNFLFLRLFLLCFFLFVILCFRKRANNSRLNFISVLGKLSFPIYVWHTVVGNFLTLIMPKHETILLNFLYYSITLIISLINIYLVQRYRK